MPSDTLKRIHQDAIESNGSDSGSQDEGVKRQDKKKSNKSKAIPEVTQPISNENIMSLFQQMLQHNTESINEIIEKKLTSTEIISKPVSSHQNGLYGEVSIPMSLGAFPVLTGNTASHVTEWVRKCLVHFASVSLLDIITTDPTTSFNTAVKRDINKRPPETIMVLWERLNTKAYMALRAAVEPQLGRELSSSIEAEQEELYKFEYKFTQNTEDGSYSLLNLEDFRVNNSYYYWSSLQELTRYTQNEIDQIHDNLYGLKFQIGYDPQRFKNRFLECLEQCRNADLIISERAKTSIWTKALPPQLEPLKQVLAAKVDLVWTDVFEALKSWCQQQPLKPKHAGEQAMYGSDGNKKECSYCHKPGHIEAECFSKHPELRPKGPRSRGAAHKPKKKFKKLYKKQAQSTSYGDYEHSAPAVEGDQDISQILESLSLHGDTEYGMPAREIQKKTYLVFDSAATSHMTPHLHQLEDITPVPEVHLTTALKGATTIIRKRGTLRLNNRWVLREVAHIPNGSATLISEGRLCDAGYSIFKDKKQLIVRDSSNHVVLRGFRHNKLWMYGADGIVPTKAAINTLSQVDLTGQSDTEEEADGGGGKKVSGSSSSSSPSSSSSSAVPPTPVSGRAVPKKVGKAPAPAINPAKRRLRAMHDKDE